MLIAVLGNERSTIRREIEFAGGVFTAEGLGEVSVDEMREFEADGQLEWVSPDMRTLVLNCALEPSTAPAAESNVADAQLRLAVETEVVYVPPHRVGSKTEAELKRIVRDMTRHGWLLVEDTRLGASGGHLAFQRSEPLDPAMLESLSFAR